MFQAGDVQRPCLDPTVETHKKDFRVKGSGFALSFPLPPPLRRGATGGESGLRTRWRELTCSQITPDGATYIVSAGVVVASTLGTQGVLDSRRRL